MNKRNRKMWKKVKVPISNKMRKPKKLLMTNNPPNLRRKHLSASKPIIKTR